MYLTCFFFVLGEDYYDDYYEEDEYKRNGKQNKRNYRDNWPETMCVDLIDLRNRIKQTNAENNLDTKNNHITRH